jgi:cytochrome b involved in lipid metabolism
MSKKIISFVIFIVLIVIIFISSSLFSNLGKDDLPVFANPSDTTKSSSTESQASSSSSAKVDANTAVTQSTPVGITMVDVQKHNSGSSCWTVVNGGVYDLTSFTSKHPGGKNAILDLCGVDGTSAFMDQHGNQKRPNNELTGLKIGDLTK